MRSAKGPATLAASETRSVAKGAPQHPCGQSANQPRRGQTDRHLMDRLIVEGTRTETDGDVERRCDKVTERGLVEREREGRYGKKLHFSYPYSIAHGRNTRWYLNKFPEPTALS